MAEIQYPRNPVNMRTTEKTMHHIHRALEEKNFSSIEEANEYLKTLVGKETTNAPSRTPLEAAQNLVWDAWDEKSSRKRIELAKQALKISPDCADAYALLAEEESDSERAVDLYRQGMEAGERALGADFFTENTGHFWGILETRPYMRARAGLSRELWELGKHEESLEHDRALLALNPNDNQGIRYVLISKLLELERFEELRDFLEGDRYRDDCGTEWLYTKALVYHHFEGASARANRTLQEAFERNQYVPMVLLTLDELPDEEPDRIALGGVDEAVYYGQEFGYAWVEDEETFKWLLENMDRHLKVQKAGKVHRNEPCPCGSGKKFKKCCLP